MSTQETTSEASRWPLPAAVMAVILVALLLAVAIAHNQPWNNSLATLRTAFNDHRIGMEGAWYDIGHATTDQQFYTRFRELAATDAAMADTLGRLPIDLVELRELRASLLDSVTVETAIAESHGGPTLAAALEKLLREREEQTALEDSAASALNIPLTH